MSLSEGAHKREGYRLQQHQQQQQVGMGSAADLQQRQQWQQQEEVQGVMVEAVRQLREQVTGGW